VSDLCDPLAREHVVQIVIDDCTTVFPRDISFVSRTPSRRRPLPGTKRPD